MSIRLEKYNPEKHNEHTVATLIYLPDSEFTSLLFGNQEEGVQLIAKLMKMENNYFTPPYVDCAIYKNEIMGVIVGFWSFLKKMQTFIKMDKIVSKQIDEDGYYINSFCVDRLYRGRGFGTRMLEMVVEKYKKVYLDVNIYNHEALKFYQKLGFQIQSENIIKLKKKKIGTYSMKRE